MSGLDVDMLARLAAEALITGKDPGFTDAEPMRVGP